MNLRCLIARLDFLSGRTRLALYPPFRLMRIKVLEIAPRGARCAYDPERERAIREEITEKGRSTPVFEYGCFLSDGVLCTLGRNTVATRPKDYKNST